MLLPDPTVAIEISPQAVAVWLDSPSDERPLLIDCREEDELAICQLPGNVWLPMGKFSTAAAHAWSAHPHGVVVYCHHGMRSHRCATFLRTHGVERAFSLAGGIDSWSLVIDPSLPRY